MERPKSKKARKQRKFLHTAPLHIRRKLMSAHLSKGLREKYGIRNMPLRKGDSVEVMRGKFKKKTGRVTKMDTKKHRVYVDGIMIKRTDGTERQAPLHPSKLKINNLVLDDKKRLKSLKRKSKKEIKVKKNEKALKKA
jgi:large subunit ribosomal protein L24